MNDQVPMMNSCTDKKNKRAGMRQYFPHLLVRNKIMFCTNVIYFLLAGSGTFSTECQSGFY